MRRPFHIGGHVLDFQLETGTVSLDQDAALHIQLPEGQPVDTDPAGDDIAGEIEQAENA